MENTNEILNGIVNQSIKNVICVDDDFLEPYEDVMETNKEKCIFSTNEIGRASCRERV